MRFTIIALFAVASATGHATLIDDFSVGAYDSGALVAVGTTDAWQTPASAPGNVRYTSSAVTANAFAQEYRVQIVTGFGMTFVDSGVGVDGALRLGYGFANASTSPLSAPLDLDLGSEPKIRLTFMSNDLLNATSVTLYSSTFGAVTRNLAVPGGISSPQGFDFDFTGEAALADVDSIAIDFDPIVNGDFALARVEAVPEPAAMAVLGVGLVGLVRKRRSRG